jgi:putative toxin-antitoxin system antitoxin component (TIGR02293 family)
MPDYLAVSDDFVPYLRTVVSGFGVISQARQGVPRSLVDDLSKMVGLTDNEMAHILDMTPRNLHRIQPDKLLGTDASERLLLLKNILIHAMDTFDGRRAVVLSWLRTTIPELNHQSPLQLLDTVTGFELVDDVLGRLDYGLLA